MQPAFASDPRDEAERLPSSMEAEQALLGCVLYDNRAFHELESPLSPSAFYEPFHQRMWQAIGELINADRRAEPIAMMERFCEDPGFKDLGGVRYLAELVDHAPPAAHAQHYAESIADKALRRDLVRLCGQTAIAARRNAETSGGDLLGLLERGAAEIAREGGLQVKASPAGLGALEMLEDAWSGRFIGTSVGLQCLDHVTGGIRKGDVWVLAGRASMGKSVAAVCLSRSLATQGRGVLFFSLEMPKREVQARLIADTCHDRAIPVGGSEGGNVRYGDLLKGRGTTWQRSRAREAARNLASLPMSVCDVGGLTIDDIRAQSLRQVRAWERAGIEPGAVVIDHIGLIKPVRRTDSKAADTSDIVNELKPLAKQLNAPVIALAQVNRATESRNDKRPTLADINWSGAIEQIADFVCLLYREAYYLERSANDEDKEKAWRMAYDLEMIIAKNRSGPICAVKAFVDIASNAIRDWDEGARACA